MSGDDLNRPLGLETPLRRRRKTRLTPLALIACGTAVVAALAYLQMHGDPFGGEPHALAMLEKAPAPPSAPSPAPQDRGSPADPAPRNNAVAPFGDSVETAVQIETQSGVKVVRSGGTPPPGATIIDVSRVLGRLTPAPDHRLVEKSRYGLLPRIGADGARPADVYARPVAGKTNGPRVVLVVGGIGLSQNSTAAAIATLPPAVTLAFAPYGSDLDADVSRAREAGHEVILQIPMEPIDFPRSNPGPHTLRANAGQAENIDDLHWLLGRFTGYAGVGNFLGGRFTADDSALAPVLHEIAGRGLFYFDDGTAPQSLAATRARDFNLTVVKADIVLDAVSRPEAIDAALAKLEALARQKGLAVGTASGLPLSLDRLERFARQAEGRGLVLIPLSAASAITRLSEAPPH